MPASIREVSSTSPISVARRAVSSLISARKEARCSGVELAPALLQRPGGADHGRHRAAQLVRDERDEVGAQRGEPPQLLDRLPLGLVRADVLHRGRDQPAEQGGELDLVGRRTRRARGGGSQSIPIGRTPSSSGAAIRERRPISTSVTSSGCSWSLMSRRYTVSPVLITVLDQRARRQRLARSEHLVVHVPRGRHHRGCALARKG